MLVDDTEALRFALGRLLRLSGFDVREAVDGRDALERVTDFWPQLVLTDLMMPVMDGVELIRHLHNAPETSEIPVLALTANVTEEAGESAREAGAVDVLAKPVDLPCLVERLRRLPRPSVPKPEWVRPVDARPGSSLGSCALRPKRH
jgi:CheY-like chemotaxis protein